MMSQTAALRFGQYLLDAERDMNAKLTYEQDVIARLMEIINVAKESK